jgi:serine/threonine protein kinase
MGVVYLGLAKNGGQVAVKVLRPELADDPEFRARFTREVTTLMRVKGACTVRVIEADTASNRPFMATEYAEGPSLAEYMEMNGPLDSGLLYGLATGLAEALTAIHAAGVVHRDLKPSNIILTRDGPKVIDFGIAQTLDATAVTKTGVTIGSAGFMAPEQIMGRAGPATDIFAWAVTVGYAASGQPPFGTGASEAIMYRILHAEPDIAAVPSVLRPLVEMALAKDPQRRPAAHELLGWLTSTSVQADGGYDTPTQTVLSRTWQLTETNDAAPAGIHRASRLWRVLLPVAISVGVLAIGAGTGAVIALNADGHSAGSHQPPSASVASGGTQAAHATPTLSAAGRTSAPAGSQRSSDAPTVTSSAPLPVVTIGSFIGIKPSEIDFSGDSGNIVSKIYWVSWTATGATGYGTLGIQSCIPNCAEGSVTYVPATITLSNPVDGRFIVMTEAWKNSSSTVHYPSSSWPLDAS